MFKLRKLTQESFAGQCMRRVTILEYLCPKIHSLRAVEPCRIRSPFHALTRFFVSHPQSVDVAHVTSVAIVRFSDCTPGPGVVAVSEVALYLASNLTQPRISARAKNPSDEQSFIAQ